MITVHLIHPVITVAHVINETEVNYLVYMCDLYNYMVHNTNLLSIIMSTCANPTIINNNLWSKLNFIYTKCHNITPKPSSTLRILASSMFKYQYFVPFGYFLHSSRDRSL